MRLQLECITDVVSHTTATCWFQYCFHHVHRGTALAMVAGREISCRCQAYAAQQPSSTLHHHLASARASSAW